MPPRWQAIRLDGSSGQTPGTKRRVRLRPFCVAALSTHRSDQLRLLCWRLSSIRADLLSYGERVQTGEAARKDKEMSTLGVGNENCTGSGVAILRDEPELKDPAWAEPWKAGELNQRKALLPELVHATLGPGHGTGSAQ